MQPHLVPAGARGERSPRAAQLTSKISKVSWRQTVRCGWSPAMLTRSSNAFILNLEHVQGAKLCSSGISPLFAHFLRPALGNTNRSQIKSPWFALSLAARSQSPLPAHLHGPEVEGVQSWSPSCLNSPPGAVTNSAPTISTYAHAAPAHV